LDELVCEDGVVDVEGGKDGESGKEKVGRDVFTVTDTLTNYSSFDTDHS
jgi:hypothetical protein